MKIKLQEPKCASYAKCDYGCQKIKAEVDKSMRVTKTNTLHQFDVAGVIGLDSPVGKVPILFYAREGIGHGRRGIIYYSGRDSVCWMFPENAHSEWCRQPYDMKYAGIEDYTVDYDDGTTGTGKWWNHGIFRLWVSVLRCWYNGKVMFRPRKKIQGCGNVRDGYPTSDTSIVVEEKDKSSRHIAKPKDKKINHSCGCRKG